jgi:DNA modification methylase
MWKAIIQANAKALPLADGCIQCVVTSPPYFGLRDYGHADQIGMEETPEDYVNSLREAFREIWRVLRKDGTAWLNLGDSYAGSWGSQGRHGHESMTSRSALAARQIGAAARKKSGTGSVTHLRNIKAKDLIGIPWMVAFALREDGWFLRSDVIWAKSNGIPESVIDRPTRAHEHLFLLAKSRRYYYDGGAIAEPAAVGDKGSTFDSERDKSISPGRGLNRRASKAPEDERETRNRRDVWSIATKGYPEAHYAVMPELLAEPCILAGSRPGDYVLDPFAGSGTVARVAERFGRRWISVDLGYQELQSKRLKGLQKQFAEF